MSTPIEVLEESVQGGDDAVGAGVRLFLLQNGHDKKHRRRRTIAYGICGCHDEHDSSSVLVFVPLASNRRLLFSYHSLAMAHGLRLICVNRPGTGGPSPSETRSPKEPLARACQDTRQVLDALGIERVGLLFLCAGAPFALAFATQHPERVRSDRIVGIAPFVSPADCDKTKPLFQFGARHCPFWFVSPLVGGVFGSVTGSMTLVSAPRLATALRKKLSDLERAVFDQRFQATDNEKQESDFTTLAKQFHWMLEEGRMGSYTDVSVVLSKAAELGIDYSALDATGSQVLLFHGDSDTLTPIHAAEWLAEQIPSARLTTLHHGTHEGALFLLHPQIMETFDWLAMP